MVIKPLNFTQSHYFEGYAFFLSMYSIPKTSCYTNLKISFNNDLSIQPVISNFQSKISLSLFHFSIFLLTTKYFYLFFFFFLKKINMFYNLISLIKPSVMCLCLVIINFVLEVFNLWFVLVCYSFLIHLIISNFHWPHTEPNPPDATLYINHRHKWYYVLTQLLHPLEGWMIPIPMLVVNGDICRNVWGIQPQADV